MLLNFGKKVFPLSILKINSVLPQPEGPITAMKTLSCVDIILFVVLDSVNVTNSARQ